MRTTVTIDDDTASELMRLDKAISLPQAIREAVRAYVERKKIEQFLALAGSRLSDYDWKAAEEEELRGMASR